ncbi:EF-hand calcium-binding domain-containing protein 7-like [Amphiura filiformis]|uniref:EF-hand calcium-binding domain-containing protein 7-like n=1 Tax=Amphiura filiformis TaxID=82378 RepID=UPI003B219168
MSRHRRSGSAGSQDSRRSSSHTAGNAKDAKTSKDTEFYTECRAAYIAIVGNPQDGITSKDQLAQVLQQTGRNPSQKTLGKHWTSQTKKMTYDDVCAVMREIQPTTSEELMKAFKKMDINGDGFITHNELAKVLTQRGEKMTEEEVKSMIAEADEDGDKKLNYKEFCQMLMNTSEKCKKKTSERMERKDRKQRKNRQDSIDKPMSSKKDGISPRPAKRDTIIINLQPVSSIAAKVTEPRNLKSWHHTQSKGCFHLDEDNLLISHQYVLELSTATALWLTVKPLHLKPESGGKPSPDISVYLSRQNDEAIVGELVTYTHMKNQQKYCAHRELKAGSYRLIPMTSGCRFKPREKHHSTKGQLTQKESDTYVLTKQFKNALTDIFEIVDLDSNGTLSRDEFNLFQLHTSGEPVDDDAWEVVEENFELKKGELTRKGFMDLNQMEANDVEGDTDDLWVTLHSMGFNNRLELDQACPFIVDLYTDKCKAHVRALPLQKGGVTLEKAVCAAIMSAGEPTKVKGSKEVALHTQTTDARVSIAVENQGSSNISVQLNCSRSTNCTSNRPDLMYTVNVPARAVAVGQHLMPQDETRDWTVKCAESLVS